MMIDTKFRGKLYKLSSLLLLYPNDIVIEKICNYIQDISRSSELDKRLLRGINDIKDLFCESKDISDIRIVFTKLFITYHPTVLCPPYLHIYLDLNPADIEQSLTRLLGELRLSVREGFKDLKDHFSLIFELLYYLTLLKDRDLGEKLEKEILRQLLFPSIQRFLDCMLKQDEKYYGKVAVFINEFLGQLRLYL